MMKLGGRCIVQKSRPVCEFGGHSPLVHNPKNVALGYDVGNISAGVNFDNNLMFCEI